MKEKARDLMVRDKFIASQRSCDLRRHLDGAAPETSILDIVDSCRIWESHREPADIEHSGQSLKRRQRILPRPYPKISNSPPRKVDHNMADRELLIRTVREHRGTDINDERDHGQCFSCEFLGHWVNHCTQLNRSFPYIAPGWSVDLRDGEYRASKLTEDGHDSTRGKEGWFGREGQPPRPSVTITRLTQVGAVVWLGINRKITIMDPDGSRMCRASQFWGALLRDRAVQSCAAVVDGDSELDGA